MASAFHTPDRSALAGAAPARVAPGAPLRRNSVPQSFFTMQPLTDSAADKPFHAARNLANLFQGMSVEQTMPAAAAPVRTNAVVMRKALMESSVVGVESEYLYFNAADLTPDNVPVELDRAVQLFDQKHPRHAFLPADLYNDACVPRLRTRVGKVATFSCNAGCVTITVTTL